mmetsp:Transcript_113972/g.302914  ORF Transcript_113972/g.302914 Transcript_113972/m.302914 type:complete len:290 (+) Transcript_113972:697-1566(+)
MNSRRVCAGKASAILSTKQGRLSGIISKGNIPKAQPTTMPKILEASMKDLTSAICCCSMVRRGCGKPSLSAKRSMSPCSVMPVASDTICPMPAAAKVEIPSATPRVDSMAPPTVSMIMLSKKPKPMNGTAVRICKYHNCQASGLSALSTPTILACAFTRASEKAASTSAASASSRADDHCSAVRVSTLLATRLQNSGSERSLAMRTSTCGSTASGGEPDSCRLGDASGPGCGCRGLCNSNRNSGSTRASTSTPRKTPFARLAQGKSSLSCCSCEAKPTEGAGPPHRAAT